LSGQRRFPITFEEKLSFLAGVLAEKNAERIIGFDLRKLEGVIIDGFLVCSGLSERHVASIAEHIRIRLKEADDPVRHIEGENVNQWILIDGSDIVIHVFLDRIREFYRLENLWTHAERIDFDFSRSEPEPKRSDT
jgi:ribosome-associated protein